MATEQEGIEPQNPNGKELDLLCLHMKKPPCLAASVAEEQ